MSIETAQQATESVGTIAVKAAAPVTVSLATVAGISVSEVLVWATLIYTVLMICHKVYHIYHDVKKT